MRGDRVARVIVVLVLAAGLVLIAFPRVAATLDGAVGIAPELRSEKTTVTTVTEEIAGQPTRVTRTESTEQQPLVEPNIVTKVFEVPGTTFLFRIGLLMLLALVVGAFVQAFARARFNVFGIFGAGVDPAATNLVQALQLGVSSLAAPRPAPPSQLSAPRSSNPGAEVVPVYAAAPATQALRRTLTATRRATERRYEFVTDPRVAALTLRTDLEQRLRVLADQAGIQEPALPAIVRGLAEAGRISRETAQALDGIIRSANQLVHGATVGPNLLQRVREVGPELLDDLDALIFGVPTA